MRRIRFIELEGKDWHPLPQSPPQDCTWLESREGTSSHEAQQEISLEARLPIRLPKLSVRQSTGLNFVANIEAFGWLHTVVTGLTLGTNMLCLPRSMGTSQPFFLFRGLAL